MDTWIFFRPPTGLLELYFGGWKMTILAAHDPVPSGQRGLGQSPWCRVSCLPVKNGGSSEKNQNSFPINCFAGHASTRQNKIIPHTLAFNPPANSPFWGHFGVLDSVKQGGAAKHWNVGVHHSQCFRTDEACTTKRRLLGFVVQDP